MTPPACEDRWLCGWRVASDVPLPHLLPWPGDDREPDIVIAVGSVPERLAETIGVGPLLQVGSEGACRYELEGIASFLVEGGRRITVHPHMPKEATDIRTLLLGSVLGFLCHQRGLLPLRGTCVEIGGGAVMLGGGAGVGKSTLGAAFWRRGYRVLADQVVVVDPAGPRVLPTFPVIRLWRDALEAFGLDPAALDACRAEGGRYNLPVPTGFRAEPVPLSGFCRLETVHDQRHAGLAPVRGAQVVAALQDMVYRRMMALHVSGEDALLKTLIGLARQPVMRLAWTTDLAGLDRAVDEIVAERVK